MRPTNGDDTGSRPSTSIPTKTSQSIKSSWVAFALGSGAFAAFNGVFAKLTTGAATDSLVERISHWFGLAQGNDVLVGIVVRALFFGLNLLSNAIMWILFTRALTKGNSTTRVSVLNTSSNFFVTAMLGMLVFSEGLPIGWWAGAALLVTGSVIIGARDDGASSGIKSDDQAGGDAVALSTSSSAAGTNVMGEEPFKDESEDDSESEEQHSKTGQVKGSK